MFRITTTVSTGFDKYEWYEIGTKFVVNLETFLSYKYSTNANDHKEQFDNDIDQNVSHCTLKHYEHKYNWNQNIANKGSLFVWCGIANEIKFK